MENKKLIRYTSRDFDSIKKDLVEFRQRYYPNISKDNAEAAFDDLMFDTVAYIGDILSFYLDYSVNESFLDTAVEFNNILRLARPLGYKYQNSPTSTGQQTFFVIVPAKASGLGPDPNYIPILKKDSGLQSVSGNGFILNEDVDFSKTTNPIVVARVNETTGAPTAYAIKAYGTIISGKVVQEAILVGDFQKFLKLELAGRNVAEIISVIDSEGNEYFEVNNLSQDIVYKSIPNFDSNFESVPNLLRPFVVPRRFTTEIEKNRTFLQFGFGSEADNVSDSLVDPSRVILDIHGKSYVTDVSFDPNNILGTSKFGIVPTNTTLTITYRVNTANSVNASPNSIDKVTSPVIDFKNTNILNSQTIASVVNSLECVNEKAIIGDVTVPTITELKYRIFDHYGSQNRAVTDRDYKSLIYSMPVKFGAIKRANVIQDVHSFKRNLNLYVVSEDSTGNLIQTNDTLKNNLKIWLNQGKMINDTINILDAKIVNIGIDFIIKAENEKEKFEILNNCLNALEQEFKLKEEIGSPFIINRIYKRLNKVKGAVDVVKVKLKQKKGAGYATTLIDLDSLISADGRIVNVPSNVVLEIKDFKNDVRGACGK